MKSQELTLEDLYATPTGLAGGTPETAAPVSAEILQQELRDPRFQGKDRQSIEKTLSRTLPTAKPETPQTVSLEEMYGAGEDQVRAPRSDLSIVVGGVGAAAQAVASEAASVGDMLLNTPTALMALAGNALRRIGGAVSLEPRDTTVAAAKALQDKIQATQPDLLKKFVNLFVPKGEELGPSHAEKAMNYIMELTDRDAKAVEERTKGAIKEEDVQLIRDTVLTSLGLRGLSAPMVKGMEALKPKEAPPATTPVEPTLQQEPTAPPSAAAPTTKATIEATTGITDVATRAKQRKQTREQVRRDFADDAKYADYLRNWAEENIRQETNAATREARAKEAPGVLSERTPPSTPTILTPEGKVDTSTIGQRSLDTGLAKVANGRPFELTSEERIAIRGNAKAWGGLLEKGAADPDLLAAMAVGGLGVAYTLAYPDKVGDAAEPLAAGLFLSGSIMGIKASPDASPLAALLGKSDTTLKTLERLPQNHSVFTKKMVEEQLARPDVTKAEKDVFKTVLDSVEGDSITPKQLVLGFKEATGDWELGKRVTDDYANYGVENLGRQTSEFVPDEPGYENVKPVPTETHIWRLPEHMEISDANHFSDPRYFGHTRTFVEDGVKHVVEIQSDLAQKARKVLTEEERNTLVDVREKNLKLQDQMRGELGGRPLNGMPREFQQHLNLLAVQIAEASAKLEDAAVTIQLSPILKDWHKRLIREELADEARSRGAMEENLRHLREQDAKMKAADPESISYDDVIERVEAHLSRPKIVRFASADTVAKVEGWPDQRAYVENAIARQESTIESLDNILRDIGSQGDRAAYESRLASAKQTLAAYQREAALLKPGANLRPEHQGIYDRYSRDVTKFLKSLGGKEVADAQGHTWIEVPFEPKGRRTQMFGRIENDLLIGIAAVGLGGVLGYHLSDEGNLRGAIYTALASGVLATSAGRAALKRAIASPDFALGVISTRLADIHPSLRRALRDHELSVFKNLEKSNNTILPFLKEVGRLGKSAREDVSLSVYNRRPVGLARHPDVQKTFPAVQRQLADLEGELKGLGRFGEGLIDYFPRVVSDLEGLKTFLGKGYAEGIDSALVQAEAKMIKQHHRGLSEVERSLVVNRYLTSPDSFSHPPGFAKPRAVPEVTREMLKFYEPVDVSLLRYTSAAINDIAKAKFFGKDLATKKKDGRLYTDLDTSIGNLTSRLLLEKKIDQGQAMKLRNMLKSRFEGGEKGMTTYLAATRNLTNMALLGNLSSMATQIGDSLTVVYHFGLVPTVVGVATKLIGKSKVTPKDLGLINHVAEELSEKGFTGKALRKTLALSGFKAVDMFAKGITLNAAMVEGARSVRSPKAEARFRRQYGEAYGEDINQLVTDLKSGKRTDLTDSYVFSRLSDAQPVSKAEMPEAYLKHPNGRILYQLKTYLVKQTDVVRRDVYKEIASGDPVRIARGVKNLLALGMVYALANAPGDVVKDILSGREVHFPDSLDLLENVFQTFGFNRYTQERLSQGRIVETGQQIATPPMRVIEDVAEGKERAIAYAPLVGRPIYDRYFGGNEKREIAQNRSKFGPGKPLSPEARAYLRRLRYEAAKERFRKYQEELNRSRGQ